MEIANVKPIAVDRLFRYKVRQNKPSTKNAKFFGQKIVAHDVPLWSTALDRRNSSPARHERVRSYFIVHVGGTPEIAIAHAMLLEMICSFPRVFKWHGDK